jgi:ATP-dependent Clp protease ATP-binding subunit ClpB
MSLELSDRAKEFLSNKWRNPAMGARPIKRAIQDYLINLLSIEIISWNFHEWDTINVDCENDKLVFKK